VPRVSGGRNFAVAGGLGRTVVVRRGSSGSFRARAHPRHDRGKLSLRKLRLVLGRHVIFIVERQLNAVHDGTLVGVARHDHGAVLTTLQGSGQRIQTQTAFGLFATVAFAAFCRQNLSN
jgi:hypothetical protein